MCACALRIAALEADAPSAATMDTLLQMCVAQQGDSTLQLINKKQQLLVLRKACSAWISKTTGSVFPGTAGHGDAGHALSLQHPCVAQHQQQRQYKYYSQREVLHHGQASLYDLQQVHAAVQRSAADGVSAYLSGLQQHQQHQNSLLPPQQQHPQPHKAPSTKNVATLFGSTEVGPAAAAVAVSECAPAQQQQAPVCKQRLPLPSHQQLVAAMLSCSKELEGNADHSHGDTQHQRQQLFQQQEQQQHRSMQWHVTKKHEHQQPAQGPAQLQFMQQQQQLFKQPQRQGRQRRHQADHTQNIQLQQQYMQQQQQQLPLLQKQQIKQRKQQQYLDAQSQAPRSAMQRSSVSMPGVNSDITGGNASHERIHDNSTIWLAPAPLGQQLFSPRTSTHKPCCCEGSCTPDDGGQQQMLECQHTLTSEHVESKQQQQQQEQTGQDRMGEEPPPSQLPMMRARIMADTDLETAAAHLNDRLAAAAAAKLPELLQVQHNCAAQNWQDIEDSPKQQQPDVPDVVAATPLPDCRGSMSTPVSKLLLGSVVAESPADPGSAAAGGDREQTHVGFSFLALDQGTTHDSLPLYQGNQVSTSATALATPAGREQAAAMHLATTAAEGTKDNTPLKQQQPWKGHADNMIYLGRRQQNHRVRSVDVGQPVAGILSCQQQCIVMLQHDTNSSSSSRFDLLQLQVLPTAGSQQGQQQQQPHQSGVDAEVAFVSQATLIVPAATTACNAAAALKLLPQQYLPSNSCESLPQGLQQQQQWQQQSNSLQQAQQGLLLAASMAFKVQALSSNGELSPAAGAHPHAGAAAAPAVVRCARSEPPAPTGDYGSTPATGIPPGGRSLKALSHGTGRNKAPAAAQVASPAAATGVGVQKHGVNLYWLTHASVGTHSKSSHHVCNDSSAARLPRQAQQQQQQQQPSGVMAVQSLSTSHAVTCLAVSEQAQCLAAAGASGFACVWPLLAAHPPTGQGGSTRVASGRQHQQALGCAGGAVADDAGMLVLPVARYRGISFPSISELCFILQPTPGCSDAWQHDKQEQLQQQVCTASDRGKDALHHKLFDRSFRVLLVGCSSQGSVAVWDVKIQQQLMAVHSPDLQLSGLLPVQPPCDCHEQQRQQDQEQQLAAQPLLLLALVASRDSTTTLPAALARASSKICSKRSGLTAAGSANCIMQQQQQQLELRPVLLQQPGLLVPGKPILSRHAAGRGVNRGTNLPPEQGGGVVAAALVGTVAAAVSSQGSVQVWDILSGKTLLQGSSTAGVAGTAAAVQVMALQDTQHSLPASGSAGMLVVVGTTGGVLTVVLL